MLPPRRRHLPIWSNSWEIRISSPITPNSTATLRPRTCTARRLRKTRGSIRSTLPASLCRGSNPIGSSILCAHSMRRFRRIAPMPTSRRSARCTAYCLRRSMRCRALSSTRLPAWQRLKSGRPSRCSLISPTPPPRIRRQPATPLTMTRVHLKRNRAVGKHRAVGKREMPRRYRSR